MKPKEKFSGKEARELGQQLGIDWAAFDLEEFQRGLKVELEHGSRDPDTNVTDDDPLLTGKIAWAHLKEFPDYYRIKVTVRAVTKDFGVSHPKVACYCGFTLCKRHLPSCERFASPPPP